MKRILRRVGLGVEQAGDDPASLVRSTATEVAALPLQPSDPAYAGFIDRVGVGSIQGWVVDPSDESRRLTVRLYLDGVLVAEGLAEDERNDVRDAGYGDGSCGFELPVPKKALFCAEHLAVAVVDEGGYETVFLRKPLRVVSARTTPVLYMDASDLIEFLTHHRELSGIQRVQAGYLLGLGQATIGSTTCAICTRFKTSSFFFDLPYDRFATLLKDAGDPVRVPERRWRPYMQEFKRGLTNRSELKPGDTIFTMGAPWALDEHNETIRCAKLFYGVRYLQIFYDFIPISVPEVVAAPLIPHFARAMAAMSIYADHIFSISRYSQDDLSNTLRRLDRPVPEISVVPMGGTITDAEAPGTLAPGGLKRLGVVEPFVLCVGTLEPRKNHMLLFQVWRRLVATHGTERVPKLVLVGRVGWYMEDLMRMLKVTNYVDGTIVHLQGVSNAELSELYDACLFTIFPSFSEGWGLPITESLARGKVCVCSNATSMPEAGGDQAIYIDPFDATSAYRTCETLMFDGESLQRRESDVRSTFRSTTWADASEKLKAQFQDMLPRLAARPRGREPKAIQLGRTYKFYNIEAASPNATSTEVFRNFLDQEDALDLLAGWNWFDVDVDCTWACGSEARLDISLQAMPASVTAYLEVLAPKSHDSTFCEVIVNGCRIGSFLIHSAGTQVSIPLHSQSNDQATRVFHIKLRLATPSKPMSSSVPLLGVGIRRVTLFADGDVAGKLSYFENTELGRLSN